MSKPTRSENAVDRAVQMVGGPSKAGRLCDVSYWAIYAWRTQGGIPDSRACIILSRATGIPFEELAGMPAVGGETPDPTMLDTSGRTLTAGVRRQGRTERRAEASASARKAKPSKNRGVFKVVADLDQAA